MENKELNANEILKSVSKVDTGWKEKARYYRENKDWLLRSAKIASKILQILLDNKREQKSPNSQKELAELMDVTPQSINKIVKGGENLTLDTISKLEKALNIQLIEICQNNPVTTSVTTYVSDVKEITSNGIPKSSMEAKPWQKSELGNSSIILWHEFQSVKKQTILLKRFEELKNTYYKAGTEVGGTYLTIGKAAYPGWISVESNRAITEGILKEETLPFITQGSYSNFSTKCSAVSKKEETTDYEKENYSYAMGA